MYDPSKGRWLEEDPIEFDAGDANLYRYVMNDPTNATDPTGLALLTVNRTVAEEIQAYLANDRAPAQKEDNERRLITDIQEAWTPPQGWKVVRIQDPLEAWRVPRDWRGIGTKILRYMVPSKRGGLWVLAPTDLQAAKEELKNPPHWKVGELLKYLVSDKMYAVFHWVNDNAGGLEVVYEDFHGFHHKRFDLRADRIYLGGMAKASINEQTGQKYYPDADLDPGSLLNSKIDMRIEKRERTDLMPGVKFSVILSTHDTKADGWIIQHLVKTVKPDPTVAPMKPLNNVPFNYYEGWQVRGGKVHQGFAYVKRGNQMIENNRTPYDEFATAEEEPNTAGTITMEGEFKFLKDYEVKLGENGWTMGFGHPAGELLPHTTEEPIGWNEAGVGRIHLLEIHWNSTQTEKRGMDYTTVPAPRK
jgi:hypothetical protein